MINFNKRLAYSVTRPASSNPLLTPGGFCETLPAIPLRLPASNTDWNFTDYGKRHFFSAKYVPAEVAQRKY
jgi:hypothetical protein